MAVRLKRALAPRHWIRWVVISEGQLIGTVEKRGMGSGWYAHDREGSMLAPPQRYRSEAIKMLLGHPVNAREGEQ